jgi:hypothetical protein
MSSVRGIGGVASSYRPSATQGAQGGFRLPPAADSAPAAAAAPVGAALPLLALQEAGDAAERDRRARRSAEAALADLSALQLALLEGADPSAILARLEGLPFAAAADPGLAAIVAEVRLRARIEAMRRARR